MTNADGSSSAPVLPAAGRLLGPLPPALPLRQVLRLARLDIDAGRPVSPPVFAELLELDGGHGLSLADWGAWLAAFIPEDYLEPSAAGTPTAARPGTADKVSVMARRAGLGLGLWHPADAGFNGLPLNAYVPVI